MRKILTALVGAALSLPPVDRIDAMAPVTSACGLAIDPRRASAPSIWPRETPQDDLPWAPVSLVGREARSSEQSGSDRGNRAWWDKWWPGWAACVASVFFVATRFKILARRLRKQLKNRFEIHTTARIRAEQSEHDQLLQSLAGILFLVQGASVCLLNHPDRAADLLDRALEAGERVIREGQVIFDRQGTDADSREGLMDDTVEFLRQLAHGESAFAGELRVYQEGHARTLRPLLRDEAYHDIRAIVRQASQHAKPSLIEVEFDFSPTTLRICVRDDGAGIERRSPARARAGRRLSALHARVHSSGGRMRAWSGAHTGTEVEMFFPGSVAYSHNSRSKYWLRSLAARK